jgi:hypothetical protein
MPVERLGAGLADDGDGVVGGAMVDVTVNEPLGGTFSVSPAWKPLVWTTAWDSVLLSTSVDRRLHEALRHLVDVVGAGSTLNTTSLKSLSPPPPRSSTRSPVGSAGWN